MSRKSATITAALLCGALLNPWSAAAQQRRPEPPPEPALEQARARLEGARRELEAAARDVARLSSGPLVTNFVLNRAGPPRAMLGVVIEDDQGAAKVTAVTPGSAAAEAGIQVGDRIVAVDGRELGAGGAPGQALTGHMAGVEPGTEVTLRVQRGDDTRDFKVTARAGEPPQPPDGFSRWPGDNFAAFTGPGRPVPAPGGEQFFAIRWPAMELVPLTEQLGRYFGTDEGLLVVRLPENNAFQLQDGDVILEIAGRKPTTPEHALRILMSFNPGETVKLTIMRDRRKQTLDFTLPKPG
ncbi:MAG: PDZ domain-containing protein [Gammaproteobacteria bacterium]|nr:PDZ domain-containing protein [Gammaproteobacteria bacterium]